MKNTTLVSANRRQFLRVIGGAGFTAAVAPGYVFGSSGSSVGKGVLVEACAFTNPGGWKIDTQHYQQMGGCYLLAHGMGQPVEPATTTVELPAAGEWQVWVRNRDWCKGAWESPGRFKLQVNGEVLKTTFGEGDSQWHWQHGGAVKIAAAGKVEIALQDLSGFDGRCDAIYFTREKNPILPNDDLAGFGRKERMGNPSLARKQKKH